MIFLGQASNYSFGRILRHLFACGTKRSSDNLRAKLAQRYDVPINQVALYHSGRSALAVAFKSLDCANKTVIIPGLTCIAVIRAVRAAGFTPVFVDIDPKTLQYDLQKLETCLSAPSLQKRRLCAG